MFPHHVTHRIMTEHLRLNFPPSAKQKWPLCPSLPRPESEHCGLGSCTIGGCLRYNHSAVVVVVIIILPFNAAWQACSLPYSIEICLALRLISKMHLDKIKAHEFCFRCVNISSAA